MQLWGGPRFSIRPSWTVRHRRLGAGHPFATDMRVHGVCATARRVNQKDGRATRFGGVRPTSTSHPGCAQTALTPTWPGNGCVRHAGRRRPG
jgi:hypothetical protein